MFLGEDVGAAYAALRPDLGRHIVVVTATAVGVRTTSPSRTWPPRSVWQGTDAVERLQKLFGATGITASA